jgi:large subunit ribosomal protein L20
MSAALRAKGLRYSTFIASMADKNIQLNRKVLSNIALAFPQVFDAIVVKVTA